MSRADADPWSGLVNARDLAGTPTASGPVRPGRLVRSAAPTDAARAALRRGDVSRVVDLRSADETGADETGSVPDGLRHLAPLIDPGTAHLYDPDVERTLGLAYRGALGRYGRTIVEAVRAVVDAPPGTVLVHCAAGKDRTGLLVALVLSAVGADDDDVVADYARSAAQLQDHFARELSLLDDPAERARLAALQHSDASTMQELLDHLREAHGGAADYLRSHALTADELDRLARRLTA